MFAYMFLRVSRICLHPWHAQRLCLPQILTFLPPKPEALWIFPLQDHRHQVFCCTMPPCLLLPVQQLAPPPWTLNLMQPNLNPQNLSILNPPLFAPWARLSGQHLLESFVQPRALELCLSPCDSSSWPLLALEFLCFSFEFLLSNWHQNLNLATSLNSTWRWALRRGRKVHSSKRSNDCCAKSWSSWFDSLRRVYPFILIMSPVPPPACPLKGISGPRHAWRENDETPARLSPSRRLSQHWHDSTDPSDLPFYLIRPIFFDEILEVILGPHYYN